MNSAALAARRLLRATVPGHSYVQLEPWVVAAGRVAHTHGLHVHYYSVQAMAMAVGLPIPATHQGYYLARTWGPPHQWVTQQGWLAAGLFGFSAWMGQLAQQLSRYRP